MPKTKQSLTLLHDRTVVDATNKGRTNQRIQNLVDSLTLPAKMMNGFHGGYSRVPLMLSADQSALGHSHVIKSEAEFQAAMDSLGHPGDLPHQPLPLPHHTGPHPHHLHTGPYDLNAFRGAVGSNSRTTPSSSTTTTTNNNNITSKNNNNISSSLNNSSAGNGNNNSSSSSNNNNNNSFSQLSPCSDDSSLVSTACSHYKLFTIWCT